MIYSLNVFAEYQGKLKIWTNFNNKSSNDDCGVNIFFGWKIYFFNHKTLMINYSRAKMFSL